MPIGSNRHVQKGSLPQGANTVLVGTAPGDTRLVQYPTCTWLIGILDPSLQVDIAPLQWGLLSNMPIATNWYFQRGASPQGGKIYLWGPLQEVQDWYSIQPVHVYSNLDFNKGILTSTQHPPAIWDLFRTCQLQVNWHVCFKNKEKERNAKIYVPSVESKKIWGEKRYTDQTHFLALCSKVFMSGVCFQEPFGRNRIWDQVLPARIHFHPLDHANFPQLAPLDVWKIMYLMLISAC